MAPYPVRPRAVKMAASLNIVASLQLNIESAILLSNISYRLNFTLVNLCNGLCNVRQSLPANVPRPCIESVGPVGVDTGLVWVEVAVRVHKPLLEQQREVLALLLSETSCPLVGLWVCKV